MLKYSLPQILKTLIDQGGSDIHISVNSPPRIRIDGMLLPLNVEPLSAQEARELCYSVLTESQRKKLETEKELDTAFSVENLGRFRANFYYQKGTVSATFRVITNKIFTIEELGLPSVVYQLCNLPKGLVLVTGSTGSGKSTTLAAMINYINETKYSHILTIEDPIEYIHTNKSSLINQRELGEDTHSFAKALRSSLRQDPDVIMVGELRDLETMAAALTAAETGHLVLSTLHTNNCVSTLNRIIDVFPSHQQYQVRVQLAMTLKAVLSQVLIPAIKGGRVLAIEVMINTPAISALIIEGKFNQIYSFMQNAQAETSMQTLNQSLCALVEQKIITKENALAVSYEPAELLEMLANPHRYRKVATGHVVNLKKLAKTKEG